jgi:hypothetical protein
MESTPPNNTINKAISIWDGISKLIKMLLFVNSIKSKGAANTAVNQTFIQYPSACFINWFS